MPSVLADAAARNGGLDHMKVDEQLISQHLYTRDLPDPDLVIRTSGEMRLSNFLLWENLYAEIYVTQTLWPDFRGVQLLEGIEEYQKRDRRYGGLGQDGPRSAVGRGVPRASVDVDRHLANPSQPRQPQQ